MKETEAEKRTAGVQGNTHLKRDFAPWKKLLTGGSRGCLSKGWRIMPRKNACWIRKPRVCYKNQNDVDQKSYETHRKVYRAKPHKPRKPGRTANERTRDRGRRGPYLAGTLGETQVSLEISRDHTPVSWEGQDGCT